MIANDLQKSIENFATIRTRLEEIMGGQIINVEGAGDLARVLDMQCGFDYLLINGEGVRGIASRVQVGHCWNTFTVRARKVNGARTEYEKRSVALTNDYIYPYWTLQAYMTDNVATVGIVKTRDLYKYIWEHDVQTKYTDNAKFYVVDWSELPTQVEKIAYVSDTNVGNINNQTEIFG